MAASENLGQEPPPSVQLFVALGTVSPIVALDAYAKATVERESAIARGQAVEPYSWTEHDFQILQKLSGE